jgi:hypothetical protein
MIRVEAVMRVYDKPWLPVCFETVLVATEDERKLTHVHEHVAKPS